MTNRMKCCLGAGISEALLVVSLIAIGTTGLVSLFSDDIRGLFSATDNALAGIEHTTPATRASDLKSHKNLRTFASNATSDPASGVGLPSAGFSKSGKALLGASSEPAPVINPSLDEHHMQQVLARAIEQGRHRGNQHLASRMPAPEPVRGMEGYKPIKTSSFDGYNTVVHMGDVLEVTPPVRHESAVAVSTSPSQADQGLPDLDIQSETLQVAAPKDRHLLIRVKGDHNFGTFWWKPAFSVIGYTKEGEVVTTFNTAQEILIMPTGQMLARISEPNGQKQLGEDVFTDRPGVFLNHSGQEIDDLNQFDHYQIIPFPVWNWGEWDNTLYRHQLEIREIDQKEADAVYREILGI